MLFRSIKKEKTGKLNFSNLGLTAIPKGVFELFWLTELDLSSNKISGHNFPRDLYSNQLFDDVFLKDSSFDKIGGALLLEDLKPEQFFPIKFRKRQFRSHFHKFADIRLFKKLTKLQSLDLRSNQITDISFLKGLNPREKTR